MIAISYKLASPLCTHLISDVSMPMIRRNLRLVESLDQAIRCTVAGQRGGDKKKDLIIAGTGAT